MSEWTTTVEAAKKLGCSHDAVRRWCERGLFPGAYRAPGGVWRIPEGDIGKFLEAHRPHVRRRNAVA